MSDNKTRIIGNAQRMELDNNKTVAMGGQSLGDSSKTMQVDVFAGGGASVAPDNNIGGTRILGDIPYVAPTAAQAVDDGKTKLVRPKSTATATATEGSATAPVDDNYNPTVGWVIVVEGCGKGNTFELKNGYNFVGKSSTQDICLNFGDDSISREKHIKFLYDDQENVFYVTSGDSKNLGRINGKIFDSLTLLKDYDRIKIGNTELMFKSLCCEEFSW